jgi:branched-chain amino acid transport system substrate-binding protein
MQLKKWLVFGFGAIAMAALLASACGDDDDDDDDAEAEATEEEVEEPTEEATEEGTAEATEEAEEAAGEIEELSDDPSQGVTDTSIKIGAHYALSGPVAVYAPIVDAVTAYFEDVGPVNGRSIEYVIRDDAYTPPQTVEVTNQLIEQDQIFAMLLGLGTPTHSQVFDQLAELGIPDLLIGSGCACWTNPIVPTAFGGNGNYVTEGRALGQYVVDEGFTSAAIVYQNDDFGEGGREGFLEVTEGTVEVTSEQTYEANARDLTSQTINAIADDPEVLFLFATPVETGSAINAARSNGYEGQIVISTVAGVDFLGALTGTPENAEGTVTLGGLKLLSQSDDPDIQAHVALMESAGVEPSNFTIFGQAMAEIFIEALTNAQEPLTRGSLVAAFEAIQDFTCSVCIAPINFGEDDHRAIESYIPIIFTSGQFIPIEGAEVVIDEGN